MSSPCGKCNTCPCGSGGNNNDQRNQQQQQQQQQQQHVVVQQAPPTNTRPKVDCTCTSNRRRNDNEPMADNYTCSRPRKEHTPPEELRCTCKQRQAPVQCECAPPAPPPPPVVYEQRPVTHMNVTCGNQRSNPPPTHNNQYQRTSGAQCGHCRGQTKNKKKKCVIQ